MISKRAKSFNKRAFCTMGVRNDSRGGDSCGIFIDGFAEYGVDKQKLFIDFFRDSVLLNTVSECKVALGHCRKASVGKVSLETAQPVVLYNEEGAVDYVLIHNGTIYNYKELAKKYIPDINIDGLTDSQVMARIFYHAGYDALDEYNGGAVFVIYDYRINKSLIFKGASKKTEYSKLDPEEERPLYYCWHNGRFVFSSIFETLYAFYYDETIYYFPTNKLITIKGDSLKVVKKYPREKCFQSKAIVTTTSKIPHVYDDLDDEWYGGWGIGGTKPARRTFTYDFYRLRLVGGIYVDSYNRPIHGVVYATSYGNIYPNLNKEESWCYKVAFFEGKLLKHPDAFALINKKFQEANQTMTNEVIELLHILDFNPFTDDFVQYHWYDGTTYCVPQGLWKWPMAGYSLAFDNKGVVVDQGTDDYIGWVTDYKMYTYDEEEILKAVATVCSEE